MRGLAPVFCMLAVAAAQTPAPPVQFICPMDPDVRSNAPGKCPRCGMALEAGIQQPLKYRLKLDVLPTAVPAAKPVELRFEIIDPKTDKRAEKFELVHEKLFHLFLVSADLSYFIHDHPEAGADGVFRYRTTLPTPGVYRLLADCYPSGGTPQLLPAYITTAGYDKPISAALTHPAPDMTPKRSENLGVSLRLDPPEPIPGKKTMMFFRVEPSEGLEPYLGAWGHLLAVSDDLVDSIHEHPIYANPGSEIQFDVFFPRQASYKVWVQFQRKGVVNTAAFVIPVREPQ
ncbi:MAG TPA: heavy metal-binding domain-containing protein [Bryobacteraceae bacterium]|nr:heavy metal-binding domain-containing protein [Bryobacteraceae bacterium]